MAIPAKLKVRVLDQAANVNAYPQYAVLLQPIADELQKRVAQSNENVLHTNEVKAAIDDLCTHLSFMKVPETHLVSTN